MVLYFIGLGLWDEKDITLRGLEIAKNADKVYLEEYTSVLKGSSREKIEAMLGRKVVLLEREDLEQSPKWIEGARKGDVALLVGGDPLVATTHSDLIMRAREMGIEARIVHNASIFSAVAESGLQIYRFGKTATIAYWEENYKPTSFHRTMVENLERGLHTLLLLDIKKSRKMTPGEAIRIMAEIDPPFAEWEIVVMSRVGGDTGISFGKACLLEKMDHGGGLHILIVPAEMHVMEKSFLSHFRKE